MLRLSRLSKPTLFLYIILLTIFLLLIDYSGMIRSLFLSINSLRYIHTSAPSIMSATASTTTSDKFQVAFVTINNEENAKKLAKGIVENKHAACVNIVPSITSIYEWKGNIEEDKELLMIIKTKESKIPDLIDFVKKNHPYDVPEVISLSIEHGNENYLQWINQIVNTKKSE